MTETIYSEKHIDDSECPNCGNMLFWKTEEENSCPGNTKIQKPLLVQRIDKKYIG